MTELRQEVPYFCKFVKTKNNVKYKVISTGSHFLFFFCFLLLLLLHLLVVLIVLLHFLKHEQCKSKTGAGAKARFRTRTRTWIRAEQRLLPTWMVCGRFLMDKYNQMVSFRGRMSCQ